VRIVLIHHPVSPTPQLIFLTNVSFRFPAATGVLSDVKAAAATVKRVSPETLVVVDGVCSVASEEIRFDEWGLDVVRPLFYYYCVC
jgi:selenocysteine lyase/cysteine desulfurase